MPVPASSVAIERPCLYLVATPIGNLADVTVRALQMIAQCDLLLAEDTRTTARLLDHYGIARAAQALHEHNEREQAPALASRIRTENLAAVLVSDAGTPLLSDPGFPLVQAALAENITLRAVPGASAALAALSVAGLPSDRFSFEGFLPAREAAARTRLERLVTEDRTLIFYESPRRVVRTLALMQAVFGADRPACVSRELTKLYETQYRGSLAEVTSQVVADPYGATGEFVVLVGPAPASALAVHEVRRVLQTLATQVTRRTAIELTASILGRSRNEVYAVALAMPDTAPAELSIAQGAGDTTLGESVRRSLEGPSKGLLEESPGSIGQDAR